METVSVFGRRKSVIKPLDLCVPVTRTTSTPKSTVRFALDVEKPAGLNTTKEKSTRRTNTDKQAGNSSFPTDSGRPASSKTTFKEHPATSSIKKTTFLPKQTTFNAISSSSTFKIPALPLNRARQAAREVTPPAFNLNPDRTPSPEASQMDDAGRTFKELESYQGNADDVPMRDPLPDRAAKKGMKDWQEQNEATGKAIREDFHWSLRASDWAKLFKTLESWSETEMKECMDRESESMEVMLALAGLGTRLAQGVGYASLAKEFGIAVDNRYPVPVQPSHIHAITKIGIAAKDRIIDGLFKLPSDLIKQERDRATAEHVDILSKASDRYQPPMEQEAEELLAESRSWKRKAEHYLGAGSKHTVVEEVPEWARILELDDMLEELLLMRVEELSDRLCTMMETPGQAAAFEKVLVGVVRNNGMGFDLGVLSFGTQLPARLSAQLIRSTDLLRALDHGLLTPQQKAEHDRFMDKTIEDINRLTVLLAVDRDIFLITFMIVCTLNEALEKVQREGWFVGLYGDVWALIATLATVNVTAMAHAVRSDKHGDGPSGKASDIVHPALMEQTNGKCCLCGKRLPFQAALQSIHHYFQRAGAHFSRGAKAILRIDLKTLSPCLSSLLFIHIRTLSWPLVYASTTSAVLVCKHCHDSGRGKGFVWTFWAAMEGGTGGEEVQDVLDRLVTAVRDG